MRERTTKPAAPSALLDELTPEARERFLAIQPEATRAALEGKPLGRPARAGEVLGSCWRDAGVARVMLKGLRTERGLNTREHHMARARRVARERDAVRRAVSGHDPPRLPCIARLTRVAPSNGLDGDNLQGALKGVRDEISVWLEVDDADPRVTWEYSQERGRGWAVRVTVEPRP